MIIFVRFDYKSKKQSMMKNFNSVNILIVDDNLLIRESFIKVLKNIHNMNIIGECSDGVEVIPFLEKNKTDIVFMDIVMKFMGGFETTKKVKLCFPEVKIIAFSFSDQLSFIDRMKKCGADGFISKFDATEELLITELKKVMDVPC